MKKTILIVAILLSLLLIGCGASDDDYSITGKWENVGGSGFGQAQPGAIVVFDGEYCNFYSPKDTYAFYFDSDNDKYVLNLTSLLGESLSKTVDVIDDDNIEIEGVKLRRRE